MYVKMFKMLCNVHQKLFDVIFLQEMHSTCTNEKRWKSEWVVRIYYSRGTSNTRRTAILIKNKSPNKVLHQIGDTKGCLVVLKVRINYKDYILANVYGPNDDSPFSFTRLMIKLINCKLTSKLLEATLISGWGIGARFNSKFMVKLMSWFIFPIDSDYKYKYIYFEASNEYFTRI